MPADLVPHAAIPDLAAHVSPPMLDILRRIQKSDFIRNGKGLDRATSEFLNQLTTLGLVDPAFEDRNSDRPSMWVANSNGSRVLGYLTGIRGGPHYELPASELADWLEDQGKDRCWNVDGDPLLTGRMTFPCPASELAAELRRIGLPLLVQAKKNDVEAQGQIISKGKLDQVVGRFSENLHVTGEAGLPNWSDDRLLYLCWKGKSYEWLLAEDSEATEQVTPSDAAESK